MKNKLIITICCILAAFSTYAQPYQSIISNKSVWTSIDCFRFGSLEFKNIRKEMMQGDTLISGLAYKKIYRDTSGTFNWALATYTCAVRELDRKVYFVEPDSIAERLLYDFTKNVGDTVEVYGLGLNYPNSIKLKIDNITTQVIYGVARKTYKFNANGSYHTEEYWYEGIGSSFGFLTPFLSVSDNIFTLKCNSKNDSLYYLVNNIGNFLCSPTEPPNSCEYTQISTGMDEHTNKPVKIYPIPTHGEIKIINDLANSQSIQITLINSLGQTIIQKPLSKNTDVVDLTEFPDGIYFYQLSSGNSIIQTGKISKE